MMRLKEKTERRLKYVLVSLMVICITPLCERGRMLNGAHSNDAFSGKDITCVIDLGDDMYGGHGLETGFCYELLGRFAEDNRCNVNIITSGKNDNYLDSLRNGKVDIVITHIDDIQDTEGIELSRKFNSCSAWAVASEREAELRQMNIWISHMTESAEYEGIERKYTGSFNPIKRAEKGIRAKNVSPYDDLLKKYAKDLGWDWRMLAAVVYQESKFSINSKSFRGAQGLMQVMPGTARYYNVDDLLDPEKNLQAGTRHLKRLQKQFSGEGLDQMEMVKFTLAAYNAGEGRIADCRNFAASQQIDTTRWGEIVRIIPLMREDSILENENVKLGKFQGYETIAYIDSIMELYDAICRICPEA